MKKKMVIILSIILAVMLAMTGCNTGSGKGKSAVAPKTIVPFEKSPDANLNVGMARTLVENGTTEKTFLMDTIKMLTGLDTKETKSTKDTQSEMVESLKALRSKMSEKDCTTFTNEYTTEYYKVVSAQADDIKKVAKGVIDAYLKYSLMNDESGIKKEEVYGDKNFLTQNPAQKVQTYEKANNIKVTKISFPNSADNTNFEIYPSKFVYRYTISGTINGKTFETEKIMDFYMGIVSAKDMHYVIYYIADDKNTTTSSSSSASSK